MWHIMNFNEHFLRFMYNDCSIAPYSTSSRICLPNYYLPAACLFACFHFQHGTIPFECVQSSEWVNLILTSDTRHDNTHHTFLYFRFDGTACTHINTFTHLQTKTFIDRVCMCKRIYWFHSLLQSFYTVDSCFSQRKCL